MKLSCAAILFDSDGVLVDSHLDGYRAWTQFAEEFEFALTDALFESLAGVRPIDSIERLVPSERVADAVLRLENLEVDLAVSTPPLPGARELLSRLDGTPWAIVTSASRRLGLARWNGAAMPIPNVVIAAEDVTRGKPHPEPYLVAADRLGVEITDCLVFEDSVSGARSGLDAGARVVAVGDQEWPMSATARIGSLADVEILASPTIDLPNSVQPISVKLRAC